MENRRMKIQRRLDISLIVKYIMIFNMDGEGIPSQFSSNIPRSASKPRKNHNFTRLSSFQFTFYFLKFRCIIQNIYQLGGNYKPKTIEFQFFNSVLSVCLPTNQPKIYIIYRSSYKITMEQLQPNFQYFSTLAAQSRNLYRTDFDAPQPDLDHKKKIIELKLKNEFHHATDIFYKQKELEQATQKQPHQVEQESKTQEGQKKSGLEPEKKSFLQELIEEINSTPADKKNKISTFQKYENNADETKHQKKAQNTVALSNKLEMNLVEATRLGTIKASSIRKLIKPTWHPPYKLYRVIAGHQGWVRAVAVSPCNTFFATGSADRTIKFFDLASGQLKISLTGHINTIRGLQFSDKHPYLFSCGEDKSVKCWDLEMNKVIRNYHGHLSGVYCLKIHQDLSVLVTGGRDSTARVWDIRVRRQIHALTGHSHTVGSVITQEHEPHVVTGSYDSFVKLWDIGQGKCMKTLTNHKKSIRTMVSHPKEYTFATGASDNIKVWKCPNGQFLRNISGHNSIIDSMAINDDGVLVTGGDDGTMKFWDWSSGYNFQSITSQPQPGSIAAENAIFALTFDRSGSRLITGECDKTIKMYKEDENATEETHPIKNFKMEFY